MAREENQKRNKKTAGIVPAVLIVLICASLVALRYRSFREIPAEQPSPTPTVSAEPTPVPTPVQPTPEPTMSPGELQAQKEAKREALRAEAAQYSFYQKLEKGYDVNILVLGDASAADRVNGIVNGAKFSGLAKYLKEKYLPDSDAEVSVTNLAYESGSLLADAIRISAMPTEPTYDLVILSYGLNEKKRDTRMSLYEAEKPNPDLWPHYSALLMAINMKFPDASIICTLEPCFHKITEELSGMKRISEEYYQIPVIDLYSALREKGDEVYYDYFDADKTLPNEKGITEWIRLLCETIDANVENSTGKTMPIGSYFERANGIVWLSYFPVSDPRISRRDDTSYTLDVKAKGISYLLHKRTLGREDVKVIADDMLYSFGKQLGVETPDGSYLTLLHEQLLCTESFEIIFADKELADELEGIYLVEYTP